MGKKNKAKTLFNAQRAAVASLQSPTESLAAEQAAIPVFSLSTAGLADYEIHEYPVFLVAVQEFQTANNNSRTLAELWNRAYSLGREDGEEDAWLKGHEQGYTKGQTAGFKLGMKSGPSKMEQAFVGHVGIGKCSTGHSLRVDAAVNTDNEPPALSAIIQMENDITALHDNEVQEIHDEAWQDGYEDGSKVGEKYGYEKGMRAGIMKMEEAFVGHVSAGECSAGRSLRVNAAVNTENTSPTSSAAIQTENNDAASVTDYQSLGDVSHTFDWANDVSSIPIHHLPHPQTRRNIGSLRTEGVSKPFSSLQRRAYAQRKQKKCDSTTQTNAQDTPKHHTSTYRPRRRPKGLASSIPVFTVTYTVPPADAKLDWDRDPRLIQLSCALRSLGWSPPR